MNEQQIQAIKQFEPIPAIQTYQRREIIENLLKYQELIDANAWIDQFCVTTAITTGGQGRPDGEHERELPNRAHVLQRKVSDSQKRTDARRSTSTLPKPRNIVEDVQTTA